ncbi:dephospho-CoA kinase [Mesonia sp. HuA40]|uniref:dephospho-CoA kinase n=1 Tax=Mesonia sp. HuA40 TaxID=2602761 RepID=UPI0011CC0028|nr:dephospho-CoA kinase [Mesonia sp. HuA40]TXK74320.1 dephospho-CoA kinase [Mesonia sp. HuA40]
MMVVGLTGGIGSGKTTVARFFQELGVPLYIADLKAKDLLHQDEHLQKEIIALLGEEAFINGKYNTTYVSSLVFADPKLLKKLNAIIHPAVHADFKKWISNQKAHYVIYEAAILFEQNRQDQVDYTILVTAPLEERIKRVTQRDQTNRQAVLDRINKQWSDERKKLLADLVIENKVLSATKTRVQEIHKYLLSLVSK